VVPGVTVGREEEVVVIVGRGLTLICKAFDFVVSVIEVALTVAVNALFTEAGVL
jgi:hypothetical protein